MLCVSGLLMQNGCSDLVEASKQGRTDLVSGLLQNGAGVTSQDKVCITSMYTATILTLQAQ